VFAEKHSIGFALLSDADSATIRAFGIFNFNIAPGLRSYGVPHPVDYLVAPDGVVVRKYFIPDYTHRPAASSVALREFGSVPQGTPKVIVHSGAVTAEIRLADENAFAGQEIGYIANFSVEPGWHVYPTTSVDFNDPKVVHQSFALEERAAYNGSFQGTGSLLLKFPLEAGPTALSGRISFQQCSDAICEPPESAAFDLPLVVLPLVAATR
jgi:hypothetical protein